MNPANTPGKFLSILALGAFIALLTACGGDNGTTAATNNNTPPVASGITDNTFGTGNLYYWSGTSNGNPTDDVGYDVVADPSGGYYVVGASGSSPSGMGSIWKLTDNGTLDTTFNATGILYPGTGRSYRAMYSGGNLIIASFLSTTSGQIVCITPAGVLCPAFNGGSNLTIPTYSLAVAAASGNGDIVVAGGNGAAGWITSVTRASSAGVLGATYTSPGPLGTAGGNQARGVAVDAAGYAYVSGMAPVGAVNHTFLLKLNPAMVLDTTFNTGGSIPGVLDMGSGNGGPVAFDSSGNLLVGSDNSVMRVSTSGVIDNTFATTGKLNSAVTIDKIAVDGNGKIILIGRSGGSNVKACRYSSGGSTDSSFFDATGCHSYSLFSGPWGGTEIAGGTVDSSNRVLVTYPFDTGNVAYLTDVSVFRLTP